MKDYPNGFIFTFFEKMVPDDFTKSEFDGLYLDPSLEYSYAKKGNISVIISGVYVSTFDQEKVEAESLLICLIDSEESFFNLIDCISGRYFVIFRVDDKVRILNDATSMRSIFYNTDYTAVSSHANLVTDRNKLDIFFRSGFPGNGTPFEDVKLLIPNTLVNFSDKKTERFWPRKEIRKIDASVSANKVSEYVITAIRNVSKMGGISLALTAGLDSRATLALMIKSGVKFNTYTYGNGPDTARDIAVARIISEKLNLQHHHIKTKSPSQEAKKVLDKTTYASHHRTAIEPLIDFYNGGQKIAITSNLLEIGRAYYSYINDDALPITPGGLRNLYINSMIRPVREDILKNDSLMLLFYKLFEDFFKDSHYNKPREHNFDPHDQFYWEHRMAAWHGVNMNERDYYANAFIPFNSRNIFECLLGVEKKERVEGSVFKKIINDACIGEEFYPINPKKY